MGFRRPTGNAVKTLVSALVIGFCTVYLLAVSCDFGRISPRPSKSELSECHFLLKHSYIDGADGRALINAAVDSLEPYTSKTDFQQSPIPENASEEEALEGLEDLVESLSHDNSGLSKQEAVYIALQGMVKSLDDPYTLAMDPEAYAKFQETIQSRPFGGVGLQLVREHDSFLVEAVLAGTPADIAGILPGDLVLAIGQADLAVLSVKEAEALLAGDVGSRIECRFSRAGSSFSRVLERVHLKTRSVRSRVVPIEKGPVVAWVRVDSLKDSTGTELEKEIEQLQESQPDILVLDLRDNLGGYVDAALKVSSLFLDSGLPVVTIQSRDKTDVRATLSEKVRAETLPLIVYVNRRTASSAEILAACLQDYKRATVVGEKTYGKGSVQSLHEFESGGGLKFTVARYSSPKGRVLDGNGLEPDLKLEEEDILPYCEKLWTAKSYP